MKFYDKDDEVSHSQFSYLNDSNISDVAVTKAAK